MKSSARQHVSRRFWLSGLPLALAVLEMFHPHPRNRFDLDAQTWLLVHYLRVPGGFRARPCPVQDARVARRPRDVREFGGRRLAAMGADRSSEERRRSVATGAS
jgi:hypothetical protein